MASDLVVREGGGGKREKGGGSLAIFFPLECCVVIGYSLCVFQGGCVT